MHKNVKDMKGQIFGRLTVIKERARRNSKGEVRWLCRCICGNLVAVDGRSLRIGRTKSCGCLLREVMREVAKKCNYKHGDWKTKLYLIWGAMKTRCYYPHTNCYHRYGGRGIQVCGEWRDDYPAFKQWAVASGYLPGMTIDRIDNNGNYESNNCQWLTKSEHSKKSFRDRVNKTTNLSPLNTKS